jgi:cellulose biosynthesis protein BcsQ
MNRTVLTFFNNKGGVGKTSLVYHVAWMLTELGHRVLVCDLDPQANLTAAFLSEDELAELWEGKSFPPNEASTIYRCVQPLTEVGDLREPELTRVTSSLSLLPGDLALSGFEDQLSSEWPASLGSANPYRSFRVLTAFWQIIQKGAALSEAELILVDVGPNLGAINRSALIASDSIVVPLGADLFSLQGLRNLGPALARWRQDWQKRLDHWSSPSFPLPKGRMRPLGYVVQQHSVRLSRPVKAYDRWINRIPAEYRRSVLDDGRPSENLRPADDPYCLATLKHYRSLVPMAQEARKPVFSLTVADGAIGSHALAVRDAYADFKALTEHILSQVWAGQAA